MCDVSVLNPVLVKETEAYSGISDSKEAVEFALRLYLKNAQKNESLKSAFDESFTDAKNSGYASSEKWSRDELYAR